MDAFYAAVEVLDNPQLAGLPVIVGGLGSRGVVSTASYEARRFGVHSALPIYQARKLCPQGIYLKPRMERYQAISQQIMKIFHRYTPLVEPLSLDEAFLDVTGSLKLFGPAEKIARQIKAEVKMEIGLTVSAGLASQKHLAKIASGMNKPDGLTIVPIGGELNFLWPLPLKALWGVGKVALAKLTDIGLATIGDLAALDQKFLEKNFGQSGLTLWSLANGHDLRQVIPNEKVKSVGAENTYAKNLESFEEQREAVLAQSIEAAHRLRSKNLKGRSITLKLRDGNFKTITRAKTLDQPTDQRQTIAQIALELFKKEKPGPLRLIGVTISGLCPANSPPLKTPGLFDQNDEKNLKRGQSLNEAVDQIEKKFGKNKIKPATLAKEKFQQEES